jgi:hypothetical protein
MKRSLITLLSSTALLAFALSFSVSARAFEGDKDGEQGNGHAKSQQGMHGQLSGMIVLNTNLTVQRMDYLEQSYRDCMTLAALNSADMEDAKVECQKQSEAKTRKLFPDDSSTPNDHGVERIVPSNPDADPESP